MDTHALVWYLEANPRLSRAAHSALTSPTSQLVIPTIVLAEVTFLYSKKRIATDVPAILTRLGPVRNCTVYPLDEAVVEQLPTTLDIHNAIIVATAKVFRDSLDEDTAVITHDRAMTASGAVKVVW